MSKKPRTEEQKLRRKYLEDCKKKGVKPLPMNEWIDRLMKKIDKKPACPKHKKTVVIHEGDVILFKNYRTNRLFRLAMLMLVDVYKDYVINGGKRTVIKKTGCEVK